MMRFTPKSRSLVHNSLFGLGTSVLQFAASLLLPALLVRTITTAEYAVYATAYAFFPLLTIVPQAIRSGCASQLQVTARTHGIVETTAAFGWFISLIGTITIIIAAISIMLAVSLGTGSAVESPFFIVGLASMVGAATAILAAIAVFGPASAAQDFLPDNMFKVAPTALNLISVAMILWLRPDQPLLWLFLLYAGSHALPALFLLVLYDVGLFGAVVRHTRAAAAALPLLWRGFRMLIWWNLTAYLASTAAVTIVGLHHPESVAPFSIAVSLIGVISGALIAMTGPILARIASTANDEPAIRRRLFLRVNAGFQFYIIITAVTLSLIPDVGYKLWLGEDMALPVHHFCLLLLPAYVLRLLTMAFTLFVMGHGRQDQMVWSPTVEAVTATLLAFLFSLIFGVNGIAFALLVSAFIRLVMTFTHDIPDHGDALAIRRSDLFASLWRWWSERR
jgi:O-antigen/teichoic acid export membrane protein